MELEREKGDDMKPSVSTKVTGSEKEKTKSSQSQVCFFFELSNLTRKKGWGGPNFVKHVQKNYTIVRYQRARST